MYKAAWLCLLLCGANGQRSFLDGDLDLLDGVKLVSVPVSNSIDEESGRSFGDDSPLYRMSKFLQGHELHVKLPNLIEKEKISQILVESLKVLDQTNKDNAVTGRKKGGGGGAGSIGLLGLMFAKTLGAIGIGGLGLLTMKALMVSALALMLSAVVGIKKLSSGHEESGHQVYHVEAGHHHDHHRKRRDVHEDMEPLPYKGWSQYNPYGSQ